MKSEVHEFSLRILFLDIIVCVKWEGGIYENDTIVLKLTSSIIMMSKGKLKMKVIKCGQSVYGSKGNLMLVQIRNINRVRKCKV